MKGIWQVSMSVRADGMSNVLHVTVDGLFFGTQLRRDGVSVGKFLSDRDLFFIGKTRERMGARLKSR